MFARLVWTCAFLGACSGPGDSALFGSGAVHEGDTKDAGVTEDAGAETGSDATAPPGVAGGPAPGSGGARPVPMDAGSGGHAACLPNYVWSEKARDCLCALPSCPVGPPVGSGGAPGAGGRVGAGGAVPASGGRETGGALGSGGMAMVGAGGAAGRAGSGGAGTGGATTNSCDAGGLYYLDVSDPAAPACKACAGGMLSCKPPFNFCETNGASPLNCGACGNACAGNLACVQGSTLWISHVCKPSSSP